MINRRIGVLLMVVTAYATSAAAQDAEPSDARLGQLERLVAQLQAHFHSSSQMNRHEGAASCASAAVGPNNNSVGQMQSAYHHLIVPVAHGAIPVHPSVPVG